MSLSLNNPRQDLWLQTRVDTEGNYWHFIGKYEDGQMFLSTEEVVDDKQLQLRMVFYNISADSLDWKWESSDDGGQTWQLKWKIDYRRSL
jgi:hypothetical protein